MATYVLRRKVFAAASSALPIHVSGASLKTKPSLIQKGKEVIAEQATRAKNFYNRQGKLGKAGIIAGTVAVPVAAIASGVAHKKRAARKKAEAEQVEYSEKTGAKKRKVYLADNSVRGYGRSYLVGGPLSMIGTYVGSKEATKAHKEGNSVDQIKGRASRKAAKVSGAIGAAAGAASGALLSHSLGFKNSIAARAGLMSGLGVGALSAAGGYLGANKNTRSRLEKGLIEAQYQQD